jgi:hypothetical protein
MSGINQKTIDAGVDILTLKTTPAGIASSISNAVAGNEAKSCRCARGS